MNAELTELVFILDRSGSMNGLESDTIGGFNGMVSRQKAEGEKVNVTTVLFDDEVDIIHDRFSIDIIEPLTDKEYFVRGCTALLDAVGSTINKVENIQKHLPDPYRHRLHLPMVTSRMMKEIWLRVIGTTCSMVWQESLPVRKAYMWKLYFLVHLRMQVQERVLKSTCLVRQTVRKNGRMMKWEAALMMASI